MAVVQVLETMRAVAPFGVRCWDPVLDDQVRAGLTLTAWPESGVGRRVRGFRTASDVYALHGLPGLQAFEYPTAEAAAVGSPPSPPPTRGFVVQIDDLEERYLSAAFRVDLPLPDPGVFLSPPLSSPASGTPAGFLLFSTPTRRAPSWLAVVRGELEDVTDGTPARHALVRVELAGDTYFGLADDAGRFAALLRYPAPEELLGGSPGGGGPRSLAESTWPLSVEVLYSPASHEPLAGTPLPGYLSLLQQEPAEIFTTTPADGGIAQPDWSGELAYRQQLVLRTAGTSKLLIRPGDSSP